MCCKVTKENLLCIKQFSFSLRLNTYCGLLRIELLPESLLHCLCSIRLWRDSAQERNRETGEERDHPSFSCKSFPVSITRRWFSPQPTDLVSSCLPYFQISLTVTSPRKHWLLFPAFFPPYRFRECKFYSLVFDSDICFPYLLSLLHICSIPILPFSFLVASIQILCA